MVLGADPGNLDPQFTAIASAWQVDRFLYDSLVNVDAERRGRAPGWPRSGTAHTTSATYTLRKGITCADGSTLTADVWSPTTSPSSVTRRTRAPRSAPLRAAGRHGEGRRRRRHGHGHARRARRRSCAATVGGLPIVCDKGMKDRTSLKQRHGRHRPVHPHRGGRQRPLHATRRKDYAWGPGDCEGRPGRPARQGRDQGRRERDAPRRTCCSPARSTPPRSSARTASGCEAQKLFSREVDGAAGRAVVQPEGRPARRRRGGAEGADPGARPHPARPGADQRLRQAARPVWSRRADRAAQNTVGSNLPAHDADAAKSALDAAGWTAGADGARAKAGTEAEPGHLLPDQHRRRACRPGPSWPRRSGRASASR